MLMVVGFPGKLKTGRGPHTAAPISEIRTIKQETTWFKNIVSLVEGKGFLLEG